MMRLVLVAVLAVTGIAGEVVLARNRPFGGPAVAESVFAAFGGLRSIASEVIWFRADRLQESGRYVELAQLAHALTLAEPHTPEVWSYAAWNLAYNVSVMMPTAEDRWRWVSSALTLLRDEGLRYNPRSAALYLELARFFELKLGIDIDDAAATYRARWREIVEDVARRNAWEELKMEPSAMAELEAKTGLVDRGDPLYSAVYWGVKGLAFAGDNDRRALTDVLRQSVALYFKNRKDRR